MEEEKHVQEKSSDSHADASGCSLPARHQRSGCCPDRFHYRSDDHPDDHPVDYSVDHSVDHPVRHTHPGKPVFGDITKGAWYYDAVIWAVDNNVTVGTSATTFSPAKDCTRAEMIEFVWNAAGQPKAATTKTVPFTDVPESGSSAFWYEDALLWAYENEIVAGTNEDGTTFSPTRVCTRTEMVSFLVRLFAENGDELDDSPFTDIQEDDWYYMEVLWAYTYGLTDGTSETTFSPLKTCTRAEAVQFLFNAAKVA